jgi:hypothetical protein
MSRENVQPCGIFFSSFILSSDGKEGQVRHRRDRGRQGGRKSYGGEPHGSTTQGSGPQGHPSQMGKVLRGAPGEAENQAIWRKQEEVKQRKEILTDKGWAYVELPTDEPWYRAPWQAWLAVLVYAFLAGALIYRVFIFPWLR